MRENPIDILNIDLVSDAQVHALYLAAREVVRASIAPEKFIDDDDYVSGVFDAVDELEQVIDELEEAAG